MNQLIKTKKKEIMDNSDKGLKTLLLIYFAGHGVMYKNLNNIVAVESNENKRLYGLEAMSRSLSCLEGSYVITIFDCCREYMAPRDTSTRGLNDQDSVPDIYMSSNTNLILVNGCPPNKLVPAYSFIARGFL